MNSSLITGIIFASLLGAVWFGMFVRRHLPEQHFSADTKDTVKLAMGLVATMAALLLSLLVSSAKDSYDTVRNEVIQMASNLAFLDRILVLYGSETQAIRAAFGVEMEKAIPAIWSTAHGDAELDMKKGDGIFMAIQSLAPTNDIQRALKEQAVGQTLELGKLRTLLRTQSTSSVSLPLLVVVVCWLVIIFFSFSVFAPPNRTATLSLIVSSIAVAGAMFLILEMDRPFNGLIKISEAPMLKALQDMRR